MLTCEKCDFELDEKSEYCPNCGSLFVEKTCANHSDKEAEGTCIICAKEFCPDCGQDVNDKFLCNEHSDLEIYQSMVRVYGSSDSVEIDYLVTLLNQEGFHPFRFDRKANPISLGGVDYSLFRASGDYDGHIVNEIKLMVPLNEYLETKVTIEQILDQEGNE
ncbi:MAG: hypothetical protein JEY94_14195 [Melioribacteraceae bacterium]|nr:hypothetical protein [Melioribacteraceae bacterium]